MKPLFKEYVVPSLPRKNELLLFPMDVKSRTDGAILVETPHSFKGFDAEIVFVVAADSFVKKNNQTGKYEILANPLYVAMTRARSFLKISATKSIGTQSLQICEALRWCLHNLRRPDQVELGDANTEKEEFEGLLASVGVKHRDWIARLRRRHRLRCEPILTPEGKFLASPLFVIDVKPQTFACLDDRADEETCRLLAEQGIRVIRPGEEVVL